VWREAVAEEENNKRGQKVSEAIRMSEVADGKERKQDPGSERHREN